MNITKSYIDQQYGTSKLNTIETLLPRLRCLKNDDYSHIHDSAQDGYPETPIFACKFAETRGFEQLLALANEDGKIAIHNVEKNERNGFHAHNNAIFDLTWLFQKLKVVTASGDHSSKLFNISNSGITLERTFYKHTRSVKCIAASRHDSSVFATGGRDGNIILWDTRADNAETTIIGKSDKIIKSSHFLKQSNPSPRSKRTLATSQLNNSVTGLVFQDANTLISCGAGDGCIKIWDLRKTHNHKKESLPNFTLPYPGKSTKNGFSSLILDSSALKLYANCLDSNIYCFNVGTYITTPLMTYKGHQNQSFYIKSALSYDGAFLISGSSDENAYIWNLNHSQPIFKLTGHTAEVTCVAWCQNIETCIATCSDDVKHKIWRIGTEDCPENTHIEVRGSTELLPSLTSPKTSQKRLLNLERPKRILEEFSNCSSNVCENCNVGFKRFKPENTTSGPRKLFVTGRIFKRKRDDAFSPLKNLPNFIIDGVAPHLNFSPPKKKHCDWLTRMRIDQSFKRRMVEMAEGAPFMKIARAENGNNNNTTSSSSPKHKPSIDKSPLLRYFKMTVNSKCDKNFSIMKNSNVSDVNATETTNN